MAGLQPASALPSISSAIPPDTVLKSLKRTLSSSNDSDFFTDAATSFRPRPYAPTAIIPASRPRPAQPVRIQRSESSSSSRSFESLSVGMDPSPQDPNVVFIHAPFTEFPNSNQCPNGLTFDIMSKNPNWFLEAADFVAVDSSHSDHAVPYPQCLEPPRGWCPAKKKDLKDRGAEGWPEGEEPRLRCTFCRRTYAGVNAKSMWRRHVFEKHKIAMSNRRDTGERPRGRGSTKENRRPSGSGAGPRDPVHDSLVNMEVVPQTDPDTVSHKSRFHSSNSTIRAQRKRRASTVRLDTEELSDAAESDHHSMGPPTPPTTPPLVSSDPANESMEQSDDTSPTLMAPRVPPSPYDPTLTPSFRHSLPRLPLDQPWRFPSPTHPLHSRQRDLSLTMLAPETNSPTPGARGILETPFRNGSPMKPLGLGTPESMPKLRRALFTNSLSLTERLKEESEVEKALLPEALFSNLAPAPVTDSFPFNDWVATPGAPSSPLTKLMGPFDLVTSPLKLVSLLQDSAASADGEDDELQYPDSTPPLKKRRLTFDNYTTSPFNQS